MSTDHISTHPDSPLHGNGIGSEAINLAAIRQEYTKGGLKEGDLSDNPLSLFNRWLHEAIDAQVDEPTAMLDPRGRREVVETIGRLNQEKGITVVLITHHMDEAAKADRVVVLHKGKVTADGKPEEVFSQVELLHDIGLAAPESVELCWELNKEGFRLPLDQLDPEKCAQALYDLVKA